MIIEVGDITTYRIYRCHKCRRETKSLIAINERRFLGYGPKKWREDFARGRCVVTCPECVPSLMSWICRVLKR